MKQTYMLLHDRGVQNAKKMSDISFLKIKLTSEIKNQKPKLSFCSSVSLQQFGDGFSHCLIHSSSSNMIGSTVKDSK